MSEMDCDFDISSEEEKQTTSRNKTRKSCSSLFGLPVQGPAEKIRKSEYEKQLLHEATAWNELLRKKVEDIERSTGCQINIGREILTPQQRDYLEEGTSILHKYAAGAEKFSSKTTDYLNKYSEVVEIQDHFYSMWQDHLDKVSINVIHDCMYNTNFGTNLY